MATGMKNIKSFFRSSAAGSERMFGLHDGKAYQSAEVDQRNVLLIVLDASLDMTSHPTASHHRRD